MLNGLERKKVNVRLKERIPTYAEIEVKKNKDESIHGREAGRLLLGGCDG